MIEPRHVAIYLIRKHCNDSLPLIGKMMGGKDHSTILHSYRKIESDLLTDASLKNKIEEIEQIFGALNY